MRDRRLSAILCGALLMAACYDEQRTPCAYEIPAYYRGWVVIVFENKSCPPLPRKNGEWVFTIDNDGRLCTSTAFEAGSARDRYYFVGARGIRQTTDLSVLSKNGLIRNQSSGRCQQQGKAEVVFEQFFVGTGDELAHAGEAEIPGCGDLRPK